MKIADIPENLRPRDKALQYGIEELSDQELLAIIIGSGVRGHSCIEIAGELLSTYANSLETLSNTNYRSLLAHKGLKKSIALRLLATFEFSVVTVIFSSWELTSCLIEGICQIHRDTPCSHIAILTIPFNTALPVFAAYHLLDTPTTKAVGFLAGRL